MGRLFKLYSKRGFVILVNLLTVVSTILSPQNEPTKIRVGRATGCAPIYDNNKTRYNVRAQFGSNGQEFRLLIDTGSSTTWIPAFPADRGVWSSHPVFDPAASESAQLLNIPFTKSYISAEMKGNLMADQIKLGGSIVREVKFAGITEGKKFASTTMFDGILGLALTEFNQNISHTFLDHLPLQGVSLHRKFALVYHKHAGADGSFVFGDDVEKHVPGRIFYEDLVSPQHWRIKASWMFLGGFSFNLFAYELALDTGAIVTFLPREWLVSIHALLKVYKFERNLYVLDCKMLDTLPYLQLRTSSFQLTISPSKYILQEVVGGRKVCNSPFLPQPPNRENLLIIGNSILHAFDMVFNADDKQVGFAAREFHSFAFEV